MFDFIKPTILYIQISPEQLNVKNVKSGECIAELPELAISAPPDQKIIGVGASARPAAASQIGALVVNPFAHPRSLVSDFTAGQQLLKAFVFRLMGGSRLAMSPTVIIHPLGNPEGGFTQIEGRAFRELGMGVGAAKVMLWYGDVLTDQEMLSGQFSSNGQVIE